jgi:acetyl esterase/lipase
MSWNPTVHTLYPGTPPGNISTTKYNTSYQKTYDYSNEFTFNNLLTYTSVNVPQYVVYTDPSGSENSVIVVCGGGGNSLSYDPECSDAIRYWKTQGVNIYLLLYRLSNMVNTLGTNALAVSDIYNFNALPFINLYDLNTMFTIVQNKYSGKIGLHGFSFGGNIVSSYSAIMSYNSQIMTDIVTIVNETIPDSSGNSLPFPSTSFQTFINNYKSGSYTSDSSGSNISFILLMYPYVDQTCPQQDFFYSFFNYLAPFTNIYTDALTYLYSCKLYSDGNSEPIYNTGSMSMITSYYPPTYCVSTMTDPIVQVTINNIFFQNLLKNNVTCYRQLYPQGGHGFGMGYCFSSTPTFSPTLYPYNFFANVIQNTVNLNYGVDFLNGNYINYNKSQWYNPPYNPSEIVIDTSGVVTYQKQISFNDFLSTIF